MAKKNTLTEQIADRLTWMIMNEKRYSPGEKLPNETALAEELGVSRVTLREAVRTLSAKGLVATRRGIGTFVTEDAQVLSGGFESVEAVADDRVSKERLEMRLLCDPQAAYYAALRATKEEIEAIEAARLQIEENVAKGVSRLEPERAFHNAIAIASHNPYMRALIPILNSSIVETVQALDQAEDQDFDIIRVSIADHKEIAELIAEGKAHEAYAAMRLHICHGFRAAGFQVD